MMSKYQKLSLHLASIEIGEWRASFDDIEEILGFELPPSAYEHPAWWSNQAGGHAQSSAWQDVGWRTENLDLGNQTVTFRKRPANALANYGFTGLASHEPQKPLLNALAHPQHKKDQWVSGLGSAGSPLSISQAKAGLSAHFGVPEESIEIIIKY